MSALVIVGLLAFGALAFMAGFSFAMHLHHRFMNEGWRFLARLHSPLPPAGWQRPQTGDDWRRVLDEAFGHDRFRQQRDCR